MFSLFLGYLIRTHYTSMFDFIVFSKIVWPITVLALLTNNRSIGAMTLRLYELIFSPFTDISIITILFPYPEVISNPIVQPTSPQYPQRCGCWPQSPWRIWNPMWFLILFLTNFFGQSLHFNLEESQKKSMESVAKMHCSNTSDVYGLSIERVSQIKLTFYPIFFGNFTFFLFLTPSPHQNSI